MSAFHDNALIGASGQQGYQISRSVRLRSSASAYLNRTLTTPTNNKIFTISAWVKRGLLSTSPNHQILSGYVPATSFDGFFIGGSASTYTDKLVYFDNTVGYLVSTQVFRDPSAWYHMMAAVDTTQATASNRVKLYVNGTQITSFSTTNYPSLNQAVIFNSAVAHTLGSFGYNSTAYYDGYMTEFNFIDGQQLTPSSFGETDTLTGVWKAKKYAGTYGTNGFYLNFSDNSNNTATTIGKDNSGNGNNWTPNNISVTAGVTYDSMIDVPTLYADGGNGRGNYATLNPLQSAVAPSDGNLKITGATAHRNSLGTINLPSTSKFYFEGFAPAIQRFAFGLAQRTMNLTVDAGSNSVFSGIYGDSSLTRCWNNGTSLFTFSAIAANDVFQIAVDCATGKVWLGRNNTFYSSAGATTGDPVAGTNATFTLANITDYTSVLGVYDNASNSYINFGQRPFSYTPPTGFVALNTQNLPTPTISNGASYMAATTYTGTGSALTIANTIGNASFQPDFVWVKGRSGATDHALYDAVRGVQKQLESNNTAAETTETTGLTAFGSTGFTVGALAQMNTNAATYVGWQWNAGGSTVTNTSGSISAQVRANPTAGFSVATLTTAGANATIGHGLGVAPRMVIMKDRTNAASWLVYHASLASAANYLVLNATDASASNATVWNSTAPTSTVFSIGTVWAASNYVAYCFAAVAGYSAFGSYTGNGSTDGPFVYTGFRPRFVMFKKTSGVDNWEIIDTARNLFNVNNNGLAPNSSAAEITNRGGDVLSNGFKLRYANGTTNESGQTYIYAAFAENPFKLSLAR